ncbi:MAG: GxxExxY protein [Ferruginibacter sp.]
MYILTPREEFLCKIVVDSSYKVHRSLGPGLLEKIYEACICHELSKRDVSFIRQLKLPIKYDGLEFEEGLVLDVLVENSIICEIKAVEKVNPLWQAQLLSHLRLLDLHVGLLINFNVPVIKDGIRRYCLK